MRSTLWLAGITLGARCLGFVEKQVLAYYFGVDSRVDGYFVALGVPLAIFVFARELVEPAFLPLFIRSLPGRSRSDQLFTATAAAILVTTVLLGGLVFVGAPTLSSWMAPGFSSETLALTTNLVRLMTPAAVLLALSSLTAITLNGYRSFVLPASGELLLKLLAIVVFVGFVGPMGIFALGLGVVIGALARLALHAVGLARRIRLARPTRECRQDLVELSKLMAPLLIGVLFAEISAKADNFFASTAGEGGVAARSYAQKIADLPVLVVAYALSVVVFPSYARLASDSDWPRLFGLLGRSTRMLALVFTAIAVPTFFLADPVVSLLFERGAFDAEARFRTARPLAMYSLGLVTFAIEAVLVPFYYSLRDTWTPVVVGVIGVIVDIALAAWLVGSLGVAGVALALTLAKSLKVAILVTLLARKKLFPIPWSVLAGTVGRLVVAAGISSGALSLFGRLWTPPLGSESLVDKIHFLAAGGAIGFSSCLLAVAALGRSERQLMRMSFAVLGDWLRRRR